MTYSEAFNLIEGIDLPTDERDVDDAWRLLCDTGWVYELPERYIQTAEMLGHI